jgi:hypothetical protein
MAKLLFYGLGQGDRENWAVLRDRDFLGSPSRRYIQAVINLLNSGLFWQKERIGISAGHDKSRIIDPFF